METDVRIILQSLADTAANAAEEARCAVESAKKNMAEHYDTVKFTVELSRLRTQQERLFADLGRMLFLIKTGSLRADEAEAGKKTPQQTVDDLLISAGQLQQEMDEIHAELGKAPHNAGKTLCPQCKHVCADSDAFCAACGAPLASDQNEKG